MVIAALSTSRAARRRMAKAFFLACQPRIRRSMRRWAEEELFLASGPRTGEMFSADYMPWTRLLLDEYENPRWRRFFVSGPTQCGKTLLGTCLPLLYYACECNESIVFGAPSVDVAWDTWQDKVRPVFERTAYAGMLPDKGAGAKGGKTTSLRLKTERGRLTIYFMGAGGGDEQRSGRTAQNVVMTEVDKMDIPGEASREAAPTRQIEARNAAYGRQRRTHGECTMSIKQGAVYREIYERGSGTEIYIPCPHCGRFILPMRDQLQGWQEAETELQAARETRYACQACGAMWDETDRAKALLAPVLVHKTQKIGEQNQVEGPLPETETFGLRFTAFHANPEMVPLGDLGAEAWAAERSSSDDPRKEYLQFRWTEPWEDEGRTASGLTANMIREKMNGQPRGQIPPGYGKLVVSIDIGLRACHWLALAWQDDATACVIDYGVIEVYSETRAPEAAILAALRDFRDETLRAGWPDRDGQAHAPDLVLMDARYQPATSYAFCRESGHAVYKPIMGYGTARGERYYHPPKPDKERRVGENYYLGLEQREGLWVMHTHSDHWKRFLHQRLLTPQGQPGSLSLFQGDRRTHISLSKHFTAEEEIEEFRPNQGRVLRWHRVSGNNHWLDAGHVNCMGAHFLGCRLHATDVTAPDRQRIPRRRRQESSEKGGWIGNTKNWL